MRKRNWKLVVYWALASPFLIISALVAVILVGIFRKKISLFSNCIIFSYSKWIENGGYIIMRKSHWGWWPHFIWAKHIDGLYLEHLVPIEDKSPGFFGLEIFLFKGKIENKDSEIKDPYNFYI